MKRTRHDNNIGGPIFIVKNSHAFNTFIPKHGEVRLCHFVFGGEIEPNLKELGWIGLIGVTQGKHFAVNNAFPRGQPLNISSAKASDGAQGVGVVNMPLANDGDGLKATVRMRRKAGDGFTVVHAPAVFASKVLPKIAPS